MTTEVYEVQESDLLPRETLPPDEEAFLVHLLIPDANGPIASGGMLFNGQQVGKATRLRAACNPNLTLSERDRATGVTWAVKCPDCIQTAEYAERWRPKPKGVLNQQGRRSVVVDTSKPPSKKGGCRGC